MKIDPASGIVSLPELGVALGPALARPQFLRQPVAARSRAGGDGRRWSHYQLPAVPLRDSELHLVLHFDGDRLASLDLLHGAARFGASWADWTERGELARQAFHENWLAVDMGLRAGRYRWGEVRSAYDPRGGASVVSIRYRVLNAWQVAGRAAGRLWGTVATRR